MTVKSKKLKSGKHQELIDLLDVHNIIINKETAIEQADKLVPIAHQFIKDVTSVMSPKDYPGQPNEFIEMVLASQAYIASSLILCLYEMFPAATIDKLVKNYKLSLKESINIQIRSMQGIESQKNKP
jgi:hypothetical protein